VSMIHALRIIDSSDLLLNFVALPIRAYLMRRKDTVRCIVSSLTASKDSELHVELRRGGSLEYGVDEDDEGGRALLSDFSRASSFFP
jgi:anaphase-promoting complex subunit 2